MDISELATLAQNIKTNLVKVDWSGLQTQLGDLAQKAILPVIDGEGADLKTWGYEIGRDMIYSIMSGDAMWERQCEGQMKILAEKGSLRANKAKWDLAKQGLSLVFSAAVAGIGAAVPKP